VLRELRKRLGQTFTLAELATLYDGADRWARDAIDHADPDAPPSTERDGRRRRVPRLRARGVRLPAMRPLRVALLALGLAAVFVVGIAVGEALHDSPAPGGTAVDRPHPDAAASGAGRRADGHGHDHRPVIGEFRSTRFGYFWAMSYAGSRQAPTGEPDWLTLGQAAKFLGVAQSTIRKWSDQGRVPAFYTPGGHRRYRRRDLEAFLDRSGPAARRPARSCWSSTTTNGCASTCA